MKKALAFLFQKEGEEVTKEDFIYAQSVDLGWFSSDQARKMVEKAKEDDLIKIKEDKISANFDYEEVDISMEFEPSEDVFEEKKRDVFPNLLDEVLNKSDLSKQDMMSKVNEKQDKLNVEITTAVLLVAHERDISIADRDQRIEEISEKIRGKK